jgi:hypothetical protein
MYSSHKEIYFQPLKVCIATINAGLFYFMRRNRNDYLVRKVKRRKDAICKICQNKILKGQYADIIECDEFFSGMVNIIGITHSECTEEFIANNIIETEKI